MTNLAAALLDPLLRDDPAGPRITYYDDATGERIEVSTVTLANWAAKTANLLRDELGAGPGSRVAVLLPAHWQTAGVVFGIWYIGAEVVLGPEGVPGQGDCYIAMCSADRLEQAETAADEVVVLSLDAFGKPVPDLALGLTDYATSVRVHGDQISAERSPGPALDGRTVAEVLAAAQSTATAKGYTSDTRLLSTATWDTADELVANLLAVFAGGASLVQVAHPDETKLDRRRETEKVTDCV
jgi:uncharacterized protein (TIGR03089 family)